MGEKAAGGNSKLIIVAVCLILVGIAWSVYTANPGGMLRADTEEEAKAKKEAAEEARRNALKEKMKKR